MAGKSKKKICNKKNKDDVNNDNIIKQQTSNKNNKNKKKEADKVVNNGVKLMKKAEELQEMSRIVMINKAKDCFQNALSIVPTHSDALYNLITAELELIYDLCDEKSDDIEEVCSLLTLHVNELKKIIVNDTSQRGETTGLCHRLLSNLYCRYYQAMMIHEDCEFDQFVDKVKYYIMTSSHILINHFDLDTFIYENCQLFYDMMREHMEEKLSRDVIELDSLKLIMKCISFLRQQICECLQTPQSSGIDLDVKLLDGAVLNEVISFFVSVLSKEKSFDLKEHNDVVVYMKECITEADVLHNTLVSFVPDDLDVQTAAGDLLQSAIELYNSICRHEKVRVDSGESIFKFKTSDNDSYILSVDVKLWLMKLVLSRCVTVSKDKTANSMFALADDLKTIGEMIETADTFTTTDEFITEVIETVIMSRKVDTELSVLIDQQKQLVTWTQTGPALKHASTSSDIKDLSHYVKHMFCMSKECYESALNIYHTSSSLKSEEGDVDPDDVSAMHFNLLCVTWRLKLLNADGITEVLCQEQLKKYLEIELRDANNCTVDTLLNDIMSDKDLKGIGECQWFKQVLQQVNINNELSSLKMSS